MYEVIGSPKNRTFRVIWACEELGVPYTLTEAHPRSEIAQALNPSGKVPILKVDDAALTDSVAIIQFLADKHGGLTHPAGSIARAQQDGMTQFVMDEMDAVLWTAARHSFVLPEEHRVPAVKDSLRWEWMRSLERLAARLGEGPYLAGDAPTVPDLLAAHCLGWAMNAKFAPPEGALAEYAERMRGRPAFARARAA